MRKTATLLLPTLVLLLMATQARAESAQEAEAWFRTAYAPLWNGAPADDVEEILTHYAREITTHEADGTISLDDRRAWLVEPMQGWVAEGWLRAELAALETRPINASTASFAATWTDHYDDGSTEASCGWYLADHIDGGWTITAYADTACP